MRSDVLREGGFNADAVRVPALPLLGLLVEPIAHLDLAQQPRQHRD
nr:hypothetical protein [Streptomyces sp. IB201691-2A2]